MTLDAANALGDAEPVTAATLHPSGILIRWGAKLPRVCLACGAKKRLQFKERLGEENIHPFVYGNPVAALAGNLLVLLIRLLSARRKAVNLPHWLCGKCEARMRESTSMNLAFLIGPFAAILLGMTVGFASVPVWGAIAGLVTFACIVLVARLSARGDGVSIVAIESDGVVLKGLTKRAATVVLAVRGAGSSEETDSTG